MALQSVAEQLAALPTELRLEAMSQLSEAECESLIYDWRGFMARADQIEPAGDWDI